MRIAAERSHRASWRAVLAAIIVLAGAGHTRAAFADAPRSSAAYGTSARPLDIELVSAARTIAPGDSTTIAIRVRPKPGWHTYWRYAGDVGSPLQVTWHLARAFHATPLRWPAPSLIEAPPLASYGYPGEVYLLSTLRVPRTAMPGSTTHLGATVSWVACKVECVAGDADVALALPITTTSTRNAAVARALTAEERLVPVHRADWRFDATADSAYLTLRVRPPAGVHLGADDVHFFVDSAAVLDHAAPAIVEPHASAEHLVTLRLRRSPYSTAVPHRLTGVLVASTTGAADGSTNDTARPLALEVDAPVLAAPVAIARAIPRVPSASLAGSPLSLPTLAVAALLALLGGTLLNLMPCVLPVLSVKAFGLAESAARDRRAARRHVAMYGLGVLVSMWALVAILLALRAAGMQIGWGFQLQSPAVVGVLALVIVAAALNMLGVFELSPVGGRFAIASRRMPPAAEAFASGVLVTALATPCSAPFVATAIAFGIAGGAVAAWTVFTALALGLIWPVAAIGVAPHFRRLLPTPGPWMLTLRQLLAFPLFATAAWLAWIVGREAGVDAVGALLGAVTLLAFGLWIFGRYGSAVAPDGPRRLARGVAVLAGAVAIVSVVHAGMHEQPTSAVASAARPTHAAHGGGLSWTPYTSDTLERLRRSGRAVLVDFTADWCLTCKVNERVAFGSADVRATLRADSVALLRADWTTRDPGITHALAQFGRSSVPLVVLYPSRHGAPPVILPTLLTPSIVIHAVDAAVNPPVVQPRPHSPTTPEQRISA